MYRNPSYKAGFAAPGRGELAYPGLWRGCIGAWAPSLGETGLVLRDHSGFGNHGTLTNMNPATDWTVSGGKGALNFDGSIDYIDVETLSLPNEITISAWLNNNRTSYDAVFSNYNSTGEICQYDLTFNEGADADKPVFLVQSTAGGYKTWTPPALSTGWHHVVVTHDGTLANAGVKIYFDGISQSVTPYTNGSPTIPTSGFGTTAIGRAGDFNGNYFGGFIDDMRIYDRVLSSQEVATLALRRGIAYETIYNPIVRGVAINRNNGLLIGMGF